MALYLGNQKVVPALTVDSQSNNGMLCVGNQRISQIINFKKNTIAGGLLLDEVKEYGLEEVFGYEIEDIQDYSLVTFYEDELPTVIYTDNPNVTVSIPLHKVIDGTDIGFMFPLLVDGNLEDDPNFYFLIGSLSNGSVSWYQPYCNFTYEDFILTVEWDTDFYTNTMFPFEVTGTPSKGMTVTIQLPFNYVLWKG